MDIGGWTLVAWIGAAVTMLVILKVCLTRICKLSCEDLSCVRDNACGPRDA
jgi:hypothetical protein